MNILFINTTDNFCSIGLYINNVLYKLTRYCYQNHLQVTLKNIDIILKKNNFSKKDINIISCACGPGNFISTKIGVCISQGLSIGLNIPIIGISSLSILAESSHRISKKNNKIISIIDGYSNKLYWSSFYKNYKNIWKSKNKVKLTYISDIIEYINKYSGEWIISGFYKNKINNKIIKLNKNTNIIYTGILNQNLYDSINLLKKIILVKKINNINNIYPILI